MTRSRRSSDLPLFERIVSLSGLTPWVLLLSALLLGLAAVFLGKIDKLDEFVPVLTIGVLAELLIVAFLILSKLTRMERGGTGHRHVFETFGKGWLAWLGPYFDDQVDEIAICAYTTGTYQFYFASETPKGFKPDKLRILTGMREDTPYQCKIAGAIDPKEALKTIVGEWEVAVEDRKISATMVKHVNNDHLLFFSFVKSEKRGKTFLVGLLKPRKRDPEDSISPNTGEAKTPLTTGQVAVFSDSDLPRESAELEEWFDAMWSHAKTLYALDGTAAQ